MVFLIGYLIGATLVSYALLRFWEFVFKGLSTRTSVRLAASTFLAYVSATTLAAFGMADGGPPAYAAAALSYAIPAVVAGLIEAVRLNQETAKIPKPKDNDQ